MVLCEVAMCRHNTGSLSFVAFNAWIVPETRGLDDIKSKSSLERTRQILRCLVLIQSSRLGHFFNVAEQQAGLSRVWKQITTVTFVPFQDPPAYTPDQEPSLFLYMLLWSLTRIDGNDAFRVNCCHHAAAKVVKANLGIGYEEHFEKDWEFKELSFILNTGKQSHLRYQHLGQERQLNNNSFGAGQREAAALLPVSLGAKVWRTWMVSLSQLRGKQRSMRRQRK